MKTAYHIIIVFCFGIITSALVMDMYMPSDGVYFNPPLRQFTGQENVTTTQAVYHLGEEVEGTITYCKNRNIGGMIDWQLVDTYVRFYPAQRADLPNGCHSYIMDLGTLALLFIHTTGWIEPGAQSKSSPKSTPSSPPFTWNASAIFCLSPRRSYLPHIVLPLVAGFAQATTSSG